MKAQNADTNAVAVNAEITNAVAETVWLKTNSRGRAALTESFSIGADAFNAYISGRVSESELARLSKLAVDKENGVSFAKRVLAKGEKGFYVVTGVKGVHAGSCSKLAVDGIEYLAKLSASGQETFVSMSLIDGLSFVTRAELEQTLAGGEIEKVQIGERTFTGVKLGGTADYIAVAYRLGANVALVCGGYLRADKKIEHATNIAQTGKVWTAAEIAERKVKAKKSKVKAAEIADAAE